MHPMINLNLVFSQSDSGGVSPELFDVFHRISTAVIPTACTPYSLETNVPNRPLLPVSEVSSVSRLGSVPHSSPSRFPSLRPGLLVPQITSTRFRITARCDRTLDLQFTRSVCLRLANHGSWIGGTAADGDAERDIRLL